MTVIRLSSQVALPIIGYVVSVEVKDSDRHGPCYGVDWWGTKYTRVLDSNVWRDEDGHEFTHYGN